MIILMFCVIYSFDKPGKYHPEHLYHNLHYILIMPKKMIIIVVQNVYFREKLCEKELVTCEFKFIVQKCL